MNTKIKKPISVLLILSVVLSLFAGSAYATHLYFADAKGHWAEKAINLLTEKGVIAGYPDGLSHPNEIITRAEFASLVARTLELPEPDEKEVTIYFSDLGGHWSQQHVEALIIAEVIQKDDFESEFLPDQPITRMEMIRMLIRAMGKSEHDQNCPCDIGFLDESSLTEGQKAYICTGKHYHIISGYPDGTLRPDGEATRGEAFEMLVDTEKAKEQIKQEETQKPPVIKPEDKPSGGNSGGGSSYVPAPQFAFTIPESCYVGDDVKIAPISKYVSSVSWSVTKDEIPVESSAAFDGELSKDDGALKAKAVGKYVITATAKNSRGKEVTVSQAVTIYPVVTINFILPEIAHTDTAVAVELKGENVGSNVVNWSLKRDGNEIALADALQGQLSTAGGTVVFKEKGSYTLTASITDELGKTITTEEKITVYPVAEIKLSLPSKAHTDKTIGLKTETKNAEGLNITYFLSHNGKPVKIPQLIEGSLSGGSIRFTEKGVYKLTAVLRDETHRTFEDSVEITVYPVGSAGFYLPEIFHTDKTVTVEAVFGEIGSHTANWSLLRDGKAIALDETVKGNLTNTGGQLQFTQKGSYVLAAEFTDDGGRSYRYEQSFTVYPVPTVTYTQTKLVHTDTEVNITTHSSDLDGLTLEWLVDNSFGYQDWNTFVDGTLDNNGGSIHFKRAGIYELVCRTTDETGRVFLFEPKNKTEVLPVLTIGFELPELAYPDTKIDIRTSGHNNTLPVEWTLQKDGKEVSVVQALDGTLNKLGGKVTFKEHGNYVLTATMTDLLGRSYTHSESITIMPIVEFTFTMPKNIHYGTAFAVTVKSQHLGNSAVAWALQKDGEPSSYTGELTNNGGSIAISDIGSFTLTATATDSAGRIVTHCETITVTNTAPTVPTMTATPTRTVKDGKFLVNVNASVTDPDGDEVTLEWENRTPDDYYAVGDHTIRVRGKDPAGAYSPWTEKTFTIQSSAPTVTLAATPTRTVKNGKFLVNISATASDADGDQTMLEWENKTEDGYYSVGTHTVRVRAKDSTGLYSDWASKTFTIQSSAPTRPVISRTPNGNSVTPGTPITITATSTDADGDTITYVWENRPNESHVYPLGKNVVRVKAVDSTGAESPWAAIVFFVADSNGSGGMTLTGPDSVILENGIEGATITEYTFTVPPVSGHSGGDYGRVRGFNKLTNQWDQLDYGTTSNGITFSRSLGAGVYTQLEFYYFTNHNCMYQKSNITYSVNYHFE